MPRRGRSRQTACVRRPTGLGSVIIHAANNFQTAKMFVPFVVLMLLSVAFTGPVRLFEQRLAHWKGAE